MTVLDLTAFSYYAVPYMEPGAQEPKWKIIDTQQNSVVDKGFASHGEAKNRIRELIQLQQKR